MSHSGEHKEEEYSKQAKGSKACGSTAVGVTLGDYATGFSGTGHVTELCPSPPISASINRARQFSPQKDHCSVILVLAAEASVPGLSPTLCEMQ